MIQLTRMANTFLFQDNSFGVGDTISVSYKIKEGDKTRQQIFKGIVMKIRGSSETTRMITVRHMSRAGIGVERILPLASPNIATITLDQKSTYRKARLNFIRDLSPKKLRRKLYHSKSAAHSTTTATKAKKKAAPKTAKKKKK